ncbi:MAG: hypothetical protein K8H89_05935 [Flavobacteriales bacterium]|jgi:hypothetical protein|nr:hypothetical protein [Flavobacteriales bacterium]MCB0757779.1 hypothetical protein [Flavobacteriales bacterium]
MDRERLTELLQDPSQVAKQDLAELRSMAERFPWFSAAHLLLAVGEHEVGDVLANDRHSAAAAFLPSRSVLFDLIQHADPRQASSMHVVKDEFPPPAEAPAATPGTDALEATIQPPVAPKEPDILPLPVVPARELPPTEAAGSKEADVPQEEAAARELLEKQFAEAIRSSGYDLGHLGDRPSAEPVPAPPVRPAVPSAAPPATRSPDGPPVAPIAPPVEIGKPAVPARLRFTDWLEQAGTSSPGPIEAPTAAHVVPSVPDARSARSSPEVPPPAPALDPQEIVDHFIQHATPAPTRGKATFFNPQQAAKRSLMDDGMVSETLARIHEQQGNFAKAKEVYDRLAVKHPEKSVYFAALSKALEVRSNK